jgi:hypothetical protein
MSANFAEEGDVSSDFSAEIEAEIRRLREVSAIAGDPRLSALLIAVEDDRVRALLMRRLDDGHQYVGAEVTVGDDGVEIVFEFTRVEGTFGILPLSLLARVNLEERRVANVVDTYIRPVVTRGREPGALQPDLDLTPFMVEGPRRRISSFAARPALLAWSKFSHWA